MKKAGLPIAPEPIKIVFNIITTIKPIEKPPYLLLIKQANDDEHVKDKKSYGQIILKKHGITSFLVWV